MQLVGFEDAVEDGGGEGAWGLLGSGIGQGKGKGRGRRERLTAADEGHRETTMPLGLVHCGVHAGPVIAIFVAIVVSSFVRVF